MYFALKWGAWGGNRSMVDNISWRINRDNQFIGAALVQHLENSGFLRILVSFARADDS